MSGLILMATQSRHLLWCRQKSRQPKKRRRILSPANRRALDALFEALLDFGTVPPSKQLHTGPHPDNHACPVGGDL